MDAPPAQPHVEEVAGAKLNVKKEGIAQNDQQPYRNGTMIDLDEDQPDKGHNNEENKDPAMVNGTGGINGGHGVNGGSAIPFTNNTNVVNQVEICELF